MNSLLMTALLAFFLGTIYGGSREALAKLLQRRQPPHTSRPIRESVTTSRRWM